MKRGLQSTDPSSCNMTACVAFRLVWQLRLRHGSLNFRKRRIMKLSVYGGRRERVAHVSRAGGIVAPNNLEVGGRISQGGGAAAVR